MRDCALDDRAQRGECFDQSFAAGDGTHQLIVQASARVLDGGALFTDGALGCQRKQLGEQLRRRAQRIGQDFGRVMVAGEQAPQLPVDHDRDRERGAHAHIDQIFDVNGRDGAQRAHRQVERIAFGTNLRFDRHRFGQRIADDAEAIAQIKAPRLLGNVGARIAQAVEAVIPFFDRLRDDRAALVGLKTIDHHPVEAEQVAQTIRGLLAQFEQIVGAFELAKDRLQAAQLPVHLVRRTRLELDDGQPVGVVDRAVERPFATDQMHGEEPFHAFRIVQHSAGATDRGHGFGRKQRAQLRPDFRRLGQRKDVREIGRAMGDHAVGGDCNQGAKILDRADLVDRFAVAIGQIDRVEIDMFVHAVSATGSSASRKQAKTASAASTARRTRA